jgi:predicted metal-dependent peptidase
LSRALTRLAFDQPFFGTLMAMTPLIEDPGVPTLATNGERIYYNPAFLAGLSDPEVLAVLIHELLHVAYLHCDRSRRAGRDACGWNAAADYAINQELDSWGFTLPKIALLDAKYDTLSAEEIYALLPRGGACRCLDQLMPLPPGAKDEVQGRVLTAAAANPGTLPGALARWITQLRASRVPWRRVLQRFLHEVRARDEQSFLPPSRRHLWDDRYLPSTVAGRRGDLVVAVDTSASITQSQLAAFASELKAVAAFCDDLLILSCDAKVHETVKVGELGLRLSSLRFTGGGGTDFRPVFDLIKKRRLRPDALLYLTDAEGKFPPAAPKGYPVLWCVCGEAAVPWGMSVRLPNEGLHYLGAGYT